MAIRYCVLLCLSYFVVCYCYEGAYNKYSSEYAEFSPTAEKPFRMKKLNLVWERAMVKLSKDKLKSLFIDLRYHDKEEIALKKLKSEDLDKNGLQESLVRGSFNGLLTKYDLIKDFESVLDDVKKPNPLDMDSKFQMKILFRDKKLNKLWWKAEQQGFTDEQLRTLNEEFNHHQEKIDHYYQLMHNVNTGAAFTDDDPKNSIDQFLNAEEGQKAWRTDASPKQMLKKHMDLKNGYNHLADQVFWRIKNKDFEEPLVNSLWEMALNTSFSPIELESLKSELHHFEHRIKKLKHLNDLHTSADTQNIYDMDPHKRQKKLKEYNYKVDKLHRELTNRILTRHTEL